MLCTFVQSELLYGSGDLEVAGCSDDVLAVGRVQQGAVRMHDLAGVCPGLRLNGKRGIPYLRDVI